MNRAKSLSKFAYIILGIPVGYFWSYFANQQVEITSRLSMPRHFYARHIGVVQDPIDFVNFMTKKSNINVETLSGCRLADDVGNSKYNQKVRFKQIKNSNTIEIRVGASNLSDANRCMDGLKKYISELLNDEINKIYSALSLLELANTRRLEEIKKEYGENKELTGVVGQEVSTILNSLKDIQESKINDKYYSQVKFTDNSLEKHSFYLNYFNYYLYSVLILYFMQYALVYLIRLKSKFN